MIDWTCDIVIEPNTGRCVLRVSRFCGPADGPCRVMRGTHDGLIVADRAQGMRIAERLGYRLPRSRRSKSRLTRGYLRGVVSLIRLGWDARLAASMQMACFCQLHGFKPAASMADIWNAVADRERRERAAEHDDLY